MLVLRSARPGSRRRVNGGQDRHRPVAYLRIGAVGGLVGLCSGPSLAIAFSPRLVVVVLAMEPAMALQMFYGRVPPLSLTPATDS